jgi:hypothetical protein
MGVGIPMAEWRDTTGRQLPGALPSDVRKTHKSESIRARTATDPVLDTPKSSRTEQPIGTRTHSSELLETVGGGDVRGAGDRCDDLYFGSPDQHPELLVHINRYSMGWKPKR